MKRFHLLMIILLFSAMLAAQGFTVDFMPKRLMVNHFSTFDIDPLNPQTQPLLTSLRVNKFGAAQRFDLQVQIKWNNAVIVGEGEALYGSIHAIPEGNPLNLSNRDLVSNESGLYLQSQTSIDLMEAVKAYPTLKEALMAGYFPDGNLELHVSIKAQGTTMWEDSDVFTLVIRNAGAIYLSSPGSRINTMPPQISGLPVSFFWNAVATSFNDQYLIIKEFAPNEIPESNTVESRGAVVYDSFRDGIGSVESGFSEYIPFNDGCYYAWQVYSPLHDGMSPVLPDTRHSGPAKRLASSWHVFQYVEDSQSQLIAGEIYGILSQLRNDLILNLLLQGYMPTGEVFLDGRSYRGQEALDIIESLAGKDFQVEIKD